MGLGLRFPGPAVPFETESIVSDGMVVVQGAADLKVKLPSAADLASGLVGVVKREDQSAAAVGKTVDVIFSGVYPLIANGTINRNDAVVIASSAGDVKTAAPAGGTNDMILGFALETVATGERVSVALMPHRGQG